MKSDIQLQADVIAELKWEPAIDASHIEVAVKDGIVVLTGQVESYSDRWEAEAAAQRVSGTRALVVELDVCLPSANKRYDVDIARAVESKLEWSSQTPNNRIKVMVQEGWITLTGTVELFYQRRAAINAIRDLMGVTGISNQIAIKPRTGIIKADIEAALSRRTSSDVDKISVEVDGEDVTLYGSVHSWSERELAEHSAWGSPGVRHVINNISVSL